jgi:hypothetical protein
VWAPSTQRPRSSKGRVWPSPNGTYIDANPYLPQAPADVIGNSIEVARSATGEDEDEFETAPEAPPKNPAGVKMGKLGGGKRAESTIPERRAEIARAAAAKRGPALRNNSRNNFLRFCRDGV